MPSLDKLKLATHLLEPKLANIVADTYTQLCFQG